MRAVNPNQSTKINNNNVNENFAPAAVIRRKFKNNNSTKVINIIQNNAQVEPFTQKVIESNLPKSNLVYTPAELAKAPNFTQFEIDNRTSFTFYLHELQNSHELLNLYFYKSISDPFHIRLSNLFISLSIELCISAMFYSDSYIKMQYEYKLKYGPEYTGFWYTLTDEFMRVFWPLLITMILNKIMSIFNHVSEEKKLDMNQFYKEESLKVKEAM